MQTALNCVSFGVTVKWNSAIGFHLLSLNLVADVGNRHVVDGSLDFRAEKDVLHSAR